MDYIDCKKRGREVTKRGNKRLVISIEKNYIKNLQIEEQHSYA